MHAFGVVVILVIAHVCTHRILAGWYFLGQDSGYLGTNSMLDFLWMIPGTNALTSQMTTEKLFARFHRQDGSLEEH